MKQGIIFDLDGTLWDSTDNVVRAWNQVLKEFPQSKIVVTRENISKLFGKTLDVLARELVTDVDEKTSLEICDRVMPVEQKLLTREGGILYPKLEETLKELKKKYSLCIVSNCQDGYIESFLAAHNMEEYFEDYECPGRSGLLKAANIRLVIERNHIEKAVYVGDTIMDYEAAKEAGVPFIHAAYGFGKIDENVDKIKEFSELLQIF